MYVVGRTSSIIPTLWWMCNGHPASFLWDVQYSCLQSEAGNKKSLKLQRQFGLSRARVFSGISSGGYAYIKYYIPLKKKMDFAQMPSVSLYVRRSLGSQHHTSIMCTPEIHRMGMTPWLTQLGSMAVHSDMVESQHSYASSKLCIYI